VWIIVGNDSASSDDGFFALTSLVVLGLAVHCGDWRWWWFSFFLLFELSFVFV
jgi:hypothetical protein